jgi:deoxycytidylate deaminase
MNNERFLNKAITLATKLPHQKQRIYAIIVDKKNRILASGKNSYSKSHPLQAYYCELATKENHKIFVHAELQALVHLKGQVADKIFVARVSKNGTPLPSSPCPICRLAIRDAGIHEIVTT